MVVRVGLGVLEDAENVWVCLVVHHRVIQNSRVAGVLWWWNNECLLPHSVFPNQHSSKVNVLMPVVIPGAVPIMSRTTGFLCKVNPPTIDISYKGKYNIH